jgi:serine/threonine protein kinase
MDLSEYAIDFRHPIGHGQFGSVYRGWSKQHGRWLAIKQVPLNQSPAKIHAEREGAKNQQKFARAHKNLIPEVFDAGVAGSAYWIAMELVEGEQLSAMILKRSLSPVRSVRIAAAIAAFLRKAHALNLFHSDLKPQHILMGPNDSVRIIDFGIMTEGEASSTSDTNPFASRDYASPERLLSGRISRSAEYWSLGVILYEMLSGRHPYDQIRPNDLERAIIDGQRMVPVPDTVPLDLRAVVEKMLAHSVEDRYTEAALADDFDNYLNGRPTNAGVAKRRAGATTIPVPPGRLLPTALDPSRAPGSPPVESKDDDAQARALDVAGDRPLDVARVKPSDSLRPQPPPEELAAAPVRRQAWSHLWRAARLAAVFVIIGFVVSEGAVLILADGLARRIPTIESADVAAARSQYGSIRKRAVLGLGLEWRVNGPLRDRMLALAEQPVADYRSDSQLVRETRWRQAAVCIALADDLSPGNARVESIRKVIDGHLQRIRATTPADFQAAIRTFQAAAELDPASADPYLGLARIHAYNARDVDALTADIKNAEARGYRSGPRERGQLDEAIRMRAAAGRKTGGPPPRQDD